MNGVNPLRPEGPSAAVDACSRRRPRSGQAGSIVNAGAPHLGFSARTAAPRIRRHVSTISPQSGRLWISRSPPAGAARAATSAWALACNCSSSAAARPSPRATSTWYDDQRTPTFRCGTAGVNSTASARSASSTRRDHVGLVADRLCQIQHALAPASRRRTPAAAGGGRTGLWGWPRGLAVPHPQSMGWPAPAAAPGSSAGSGASATAARR